MKIQKIVAHPISIPLQKTYWMSLEPYRTASEIIVAVHTDDGLVGIGQVHARPMLEIARMIEELNEILVGHDAMAHEAVWRKVFRLTCSRDGAKLNQDIGQPHFGEGKRPQVLAALAGIDMALWDLKGKALNIPIWRLLGAENPSVYCYASGGYYEEGHSPFNVVEEMAGYVALGYDAVKMKCGGPELDLDVERVRRVREAIGPNVRLMLDANRGWDLKTAELALARLEQYDIFWIEEPLQWFDATRGLERLARRTHIPIATGESELALWSCRDIIDTGTVRFMQFDATRAAGITEWLRVAAYAHAHAVQMVPHHDPQIHGHVVSASPNGFGLETFPNPERDPLWERLYAERPEIVKGYIRLSDRPGYGFEIDWSEVDKLRV